MCSNSVILLRHGYGGTGKAVVVNGDQKSGYYFRIVADYIHLNALAPLTPCGQEFTPP